jgi:hypothetical protein
MEIIFQFIGQYPVHPILRIPFPIKGFIYIGNFHLMHLFGLLFWVFFILQWMVPASFWLRVLAWAFLPLAAYFKFHFFRTAFNMEPYNEWLAFAKMKYLTNLYFILGGLKGSVKNGTFCIEPSF